MSTFTASGSAVVFSTSGTATTFTVTTTPTAFTTSPVVTPGAHASTHGAGGADPITTLGTVTTTLGTVTTLVASTATLSAGTAAGLVHTGQSIFAAGSAAGPSIAFTGDTDTGVYSPGANQVGISTAGTAALVVDASQRVGIGTAVPGVALDVYSAASSTIRMMSDATATLQARTASDTPATTPNLSFSKSRGTNAARTVVDVGDFLGQVNFQGYDGAAYRNAAQISVEVDAAPGASDMPGRLRFLTTADGASSPTERLRIDSAGQLTTGLGSAGTPVLSFTGDTNTGIYSPGADQVGIATAGTAAVVVDASQRVGIGTTSPVRALHINSDAIAYQRIQTNSTDTNAPYLEFVKQRGTGGSPTIVANGDSLGVIDFYGYDGGSRRVAASIVAQVDAAPSASDMPGRLGFYTVADGGISSTERMRIDNAGLITGTGTSLGAWTAYTPTLGGTGWAIGDGTVTGAYVQIGKIVHFRVRIVFGASSTYGAAAAPTLTYPVSMKAGIGEVTTYVGKFVDASTGNIYSAHTSHVSATTFLFGYIATNGLYTAVNSTAPFAWTTSDELRITGTYEAA